MTQSNRTRAREWAEDTLKFNNTSADEQLLEDIYGPPGPVNLAREFLSMERELEASQRQVERLRAALELVAAPKRADGTYNRCREACEELARDALRNLEGGEE